MNIPQVSLLSQKSHLLAEPALVFFAFADDKNVQKQLKEVLPREDVDRLTRLVEKIQYKAEMKSVTHLPIMDDTLVIVVGLGEEKKYTPEVLRRSANRAIEVMKQLNIHEGALVVPRSRVVHADEAVVAMSEGVVLGNYAFDRYRSKPEGESPYELHSVRIAVPSVTKSLETKLAETMLVAEGVLYARDLENENSDVMTPAAFEEEVRKAARQYKLKIKVFQEEELLENNMHLIHAVGRGADVPPRLILIEYRGRRDKKNDLALVGKGITFDSGGINLKPEGYLHQMHIDMAGAATVLSTIMAAARLKLKVNIIGAMALAENAVDGKSYKPGSVLKSHAGKSVEINNTDAEGRLVLGDALSYVATEYQPSYLVDVATLTGAVMVALGSEAAGLFTNSDKLRRELFAAANRTAERIWELPLYEEYEEEIKGTFGDLRNTGKSRGYAGSAAGAMFLQHFTHDIPWAHLDIAGTAILDRKRDYMPMNGTGYGVRLLVDFLRNHR